MLHAHAAGTAAVGAAALPGSSSQVPFLCLLSQIVTRPPGQSHDRPRRILTRRTDVAAAVDNKQVLYVVRLLKLIEHRSLRVGSHPRGAKLVNRPAFGQYVAADLDDLDARGFEHLLAGVAHVLGHLLFVVAELVMESKNGNAPLVLHLGIQIHVVFISRKHFAKTAHRNKRTGVVANRLLVASAEPRRLGRVAGKHLRPAPAFEAVAANKVRMTFAEVS